MQSNDHLKQEADHNSFCKEELAKARKTQTVKAQYVDKYQARIDAATAGIQELKADIAQLRSYTTLIFSSIEA